MLRPLSLRPNKQHYTIRHQIWQVHADLLRIFDFQMEANMKMFDVVQFVSLVVILACWLYALAFIGLFFSN